MHAESPARARDPVATVSGDDLAEGLMLVRASNLKMIRLQLAMERHDRRGALEAVDDLVALDRRMQDYLADVPAASEQRLFRSQLDEERAQLNREKLTLAAEVIRRPPEAAPELAAPVEDWLGPSDLVDAAPEPVRRRGWLLLAVPAVLAAASGAVGFAAYPEQAQRITAQVLALVR
jgi:hypothetical protein